MVMTIEALKYPQTVRRFTSSRQAIARHEVRNALHRGDLVKEPCDVCGATKRVHAHHPDYNEPLTVIWMCPKHHQELHNAIREAELDRLLTARALVKSYAD